MKKKIFGSIAVLAIILLGMLFTACPTPDPTTKEYTITKATLNNGQLIVKSKALEGANVLISATVSDDYFVESFEVTTASGSKVSVAAFTETEAGASASFTMPAANVTVGGTFGLKDLALTTSIVPTGGGTLTLSKTTAKMSWQPSKSTMVFVQSLTISTIGETSEIF